jgi:diguanylate cyclase (GGDEF)-like protein/PAS domain S-box-containing protein
VPGEVARLATALASDSLLLAALAEVSDAVVTADLQDLITYMNAAAEALTGWSCQDAVGQPVARVLIVVDVDMPAGNAVLVDKSARRVPLFYSVAPANDELGRRCGTVIVFRDIGRDRNAETALQASEEIVLANEEALFNERERSQVTLNSIGDAVISTDFRARVRFLNRIAEEMTGWTQAEASGRLVDEIFFVVDSTTRKHIPCPTLTAIIEDRRVANEGTSVLIRRDGAEIAVENSASPIHDKHGGVVGAVMVAHDVTEARDISAKLARLALHDNLTDLPNRVLFADRLDQALGRARRNSYSVAVLFIDLDRFKSVNDSLGHAVGDQLLKAAAQRLLSCVRETDTVSRYGGDEFVVLIAEIGSERDALCCAEKIRAECAKPYRIVGHDLQVKASIGIACFPDAAPDAETLLKHADMAMYQAKNSGRDCYQLFSADMAGEIKSAER